MPGRVEMRAVVGGELHLLDRPALAIRQVFRPQSVEELQHARQALLVIDTGWSDDCRADRPARRFAGERRYRSTCAPWRFLAGVLLGLTCREADYCRSTRFFKVPIFSTSSSMVSPCSRYQPSSRPQPLPTVPDPMNSPDIRVSSLLTWALIS